MTHSGLVDGIRLTSDHSSRDGRRVRKFIVHHAATTSLNAILSLFQPGGRTVSANYALGSDGTLICAVDEDRRAWTSSSPQDDGEAITIEVANSRSGDPWPVSDASFNVLARLIADVAQRYGFDINDDTVLTHQELWSRFRRSYPTACPGDMQRRKGELIALARSYRVAGRPASGGTLPAETQTPELREWDEMATREEVRAEVAAGVSAALNARSVGAVSIVPTPDEGIFLFSPITGRRVHIANTYHLGLIQRAVQNNSNDTMLPVEMDVVAGYITAVNPPVGATVDVDALAEKLGRIEVTADAAVVKAAVESALRETVGKIRLGI